MSKFSLDKLKGNKKTLLHAKYDLTELIHYLLKRSKYLTSLFFLAAIQAEVSPSLRPQSQASGFTSPVTTLRSVRSRTLSLSHALDTCSILVRTLSLSVVCMFVVWMFGNLEMMSIRLGVLMNPLYNFNSFTTSQDLESLSKCLLSIFVLFR